MKWDPRQTNFREILNLRMVHSDRSAVWFVLEIELCVRIVDAEPSSILTTPQNKVCCLHPRKRDVTKTYLGSSPTQWDCLHRSNSHEIIICGIASILSETSELSWHKPCRHWLYYIGFHNDNHATVSEDKAGILTPNLQLWLIIDNLSYYLRFSFVGNILYIRSHRTGTHPLIIMD